MYIMSIPAQNGFVAPVSPPADPLQVSQPQSQPQPQLNDDLRALLTAAPLDEDQPTDSVVTSTPTSTPSSAPIIDETLAQSVPAAVVESTDSLNPPHAVGGSLKETKETTIKVEKPAIDTVPGVQYVEHEVNHEMAPEVEAFLQKVNEHQHQLPDEIVVADATATDPTGHYAAQPVIVLPITPDIEKKGAHQSPQFSIRWLVEWSRKMMKMFSGKVIYRQASSGVK